MEQRTKNATTERAVDRTVAKMQQLLARKDIREISLQFAERGTRCTILVHTKPYNFWLPGAYSFAAFSTAIQEVLARAAATSESQETQ